MAQEIIRTFTMMVQQAGDRGFAFAFKPGPLLPRDRIHREGHWHQMVHVHVVNRSGLILQHRRDDHEFWPGLMDAAVVGHVEGAEEVVATAIRETREEIGLEIEAPDLTYFGCFPSFHSRGDLLDLEILQVFLLRSETTLEDLTGSASEVAALEAVAPTKARQYLLSPSAVRHPYYPALLQRLGK
jgi:8-oxo-dGTP pyrophosphatase MutT (NUDIX family)